MAMTKAEMEAHNLAYVQTSSRARSVFLETHRPFDAIGIAKSAWPHIDGMLKFERKLGSNGRQHIEALEMVLDWAPLVFESASLSELEEFVGGMKRKLPFELQSNVAARLNQSRQLMSIAHRLWTVLETRQDASKTDLIEKFGKDQTKADYVIRAWIDFGVLDQVTANNSQYLSLGTQMDVVIMAKCAVCGARVKAPKAKLLESHHCPKCSQIVDFVIMPSISHSQA